MSLWGEDKVRRIVRATALVMASITAGTVGYAVIEDYPITDAFYMSVITISTVGYGEVHTLSPTGKVFTAFFIILNLGLVGHLVSVFSRYLFEGKIKDVFSNYLNIREMKKFKNHVIVCGYGRNGYNACRELIRSGQDFVVIDNDAELVQERLIQDEKITVIKGDATDEEVLLEAGILNAKAIIASIPDDSANVFIALTAKELNPNIKVIARAIRENSEKKLRRAGADNVVMPDAIGGHYMATLVDRPQVVEFLEMLNGVGNVKIELENVAFEDFKEHYRGKTLFELNVRKYSGVTFIGNRKSDGEYVFNPSGDSEVGAGDVLIALGTKDDMIAFRTEYLN